MTCKECQHDMWDHEFIDENYDGDMIFGKCEIKNCDCGNFVSGFAT